MGGTGSGRNRWPDQSARNAAMANLRRQGCTLAEIAARFGITRQAVKVALDKLGIPVPPPRPRPAKAPRRKVAYLPSAVCRACGVTILAGGRRGGGRFAALCLTCLAQHPDVPLAERLKAHRAAAGLNEVGLRLPSREVLGRLARVLGRGVLGGSRRRKAP